MDYVIVDAQLTLKKDCGEHFLNRAFYYGDGVFESMRYTRGNVCFIEDHVRRLKWAMSILKMEAPAYYTPGNILSLVENLVRMNRIEGDAYIRLQVYRKGALGYADSQGQPCLVIEANPVDGKGYELNPKGLKMEIYKDDFKSLSKFSAIKSCNAAFYVLAGLFVKEKELDDCFIQNREGHILESSRSNVFLVSDKAVITPGIDSGCIIGVMRKQVIQLLAELDMSVVERTVTEQDLLDADEVFLTNSLRGVQWVGAFRNKRYYSKVSKSLAEQINAIVA